MILRAHRDTREPAREEAVIRATIARMLRGRQGDLYERNHDDYETLGWAATIAKTEGPTVDSSGNVYFTDLPSKRVFKLSADGVLSTYRSPSNGANGLIIDGDGRLIACESGGSENPARVTRTDLETGEMEVIAERFEGKRINLPNDVTIDGKGRIYFTDPRYVGDEPLDLPVMGVYRVDGYNQVTRVINNVTRPNGIVLSPDEKTLYLAMADNGGINWLDMSVPLLDTWGQGGIMAYDVLANGDVDNPRVFVDLEKHGGVDGMTVDGAGNVYAAVVSHTRPGVYVYNPQGELVKIIDSPNKAHPTNVVFGEDGKTLYLTVGGKDLYRIRLD